jgi:predicted transcriptional regulator
MKAVLMSIRPEWCELIASGKKTVEVRKTIPRKFVHDRFYGGYLTEPFKVYIYDTTGHTATPWMDEDGRMIFQGRGEVIGEFVCNMVDTFSITESGGVRIKRFRSLHETCLSVTEMREYLGNNIGYGWHISELVIYDKPKELGEFRKMCNYRNDDGSCLYRKVECPHVKFDFNPNGTVNLAECRDRMERPPQSWCYVEYVGVV